VNKTSFRALAAALALTAMSAVAHHSASMFEPVKLVTLNGVVKEFQYTNPHSWLIVDVTDATGKVTTWGFEAEGPSTLIRAGIHRSDLSPGTAVTMTGHPMRDGRPAATWEKAVRADGKVFNPSLGFVPK
jgi:hypothetical protein